MKLEFYEGRDGTRHVHLFDCDHDTRKNALDRERVVAQGMTEDDVLIAVWHDFIDDEPDDDELNGYADMTVIRSCLDELLPTPAEDEEGDVESSGNDKADAFMDEAEAAGWAVEFEWVDDNPDSVVVVAKREYIGQAFRQEEELHFAWYKNRMENAFYVSGYEGDTAKKISSVAGARLYFTGTPQPPKPKANGRQVQREDPVKRVLKESIPFDLDEAYDDEIIAAVQGHYLVWWNNEAEDYEKHFCPPQKNHIKIETGKAGRAILTFVSPTGFRSVALEELVQVK